MFILIEYYFTQIINYFKYYVAAFIKILLFTLLKYNKVKSDTLFNTKKVRIK